MNIFQTLCNFFTILIIGLSLTLNSVDAAADYKYFIESEDLVNELNDTFPSAIPDYIQEQYGGFVPESSSLSYPYSTAVITGLAVASVGAAAGVLGVVGFSGANAITAASVITAAIAGLSSANIALRIWTVGGAAVTVLGAMKVKSVDAAAIIAAIAASYTFMSVDHVANTRGNPFYDFYHNRIKYNFTLKDEENHRITSGSCLVYFGNISEHGLEYERDACYIRAIVEGLEEALVVKIPQTEEGRIRVGGWTHLDDWIQGQTKVVDTGFIPSPWYSSPW